MGGAQGRWRAVAALLAVVLAAGACTPPGGGDVPGAGDAGHAAGDGPGTGAGGRGPLCDHLPRGDDPGSPASIAAQSLGEALAAIPVLTVFHSAAERTGLGDMLAAQDALTLFVPIDDAFYLRFGDDEWDDLMTRRLDDLETVLVAHLVSGHHDLDAMLGSGEVTALDGTPLGIEQPYGEGVAHVGGQADVLCADLETAGGVIHIVDGVLGD